MVTQRKDAPRSKEKKEKKYTTLSGMELAPSYVPESVRPMDAAVRLSKPGEFPYTRGIHETMYRGKPWTMRMFAGFGTPEDTNKRFKFLLSQGQTGLSTAFDMPALMGFDPDHAMSLGEVGREGVSCATLDDMGRLFDGINLGEVSTSMTINATAIIALAFYVATAEKQGVGPEKLRGTLQNDMLKEFIAQKEWIVPPRPSMRIIGDMLEWCTVNMPQWNTISISGYHIREAGASAVQELAFTLADGIGYLQLGKDAGIDVDTFAPRLSFFFDVHNDFFEEICKLRAARRMWAKITKERFGCKNPRSWILRTHCQTAGVSLTAQQPYNNIIRTTWQAMAAVLGGTQSLHTNSMDETYALPTEQAASTALRTQQLLHDEARVAMVADPLGGSYFVESLTDQIEEAAWKYIHKIDELGGIVPAIEEGFPQREIADSAYRYQRALEDGDEVIVGVNKYQEGSDPKIPTLKIDHKGEGDQVARVKAIRARRNAAAAQAALDKVEACCRGKENMMPAVIEAAKAECTLGEISDVFRKVFGVHRDPAYL